MSLVDISRPAADVSLRRRPQLPDRRRRALEAAGWRTWLTYQENHLRAADGRMIGVEPCWVAELERADGRALTVAGASPAAVWAAAWGRVSR